MTLDEKVEAVKEYLVNMEMTLKIVTRQLNRIAELLENQNQSLLAGFSPIPYQDAEDATT